MLLGNSPDVKKREREREREREEEGEREVGRKLKEGKTGIGPMRRLS